MLIKKLCSTQTTNYHLSHISALVNTILYQDDKFNLCARISCVKCGSKICFIYAIKVNSYGNLDAYTNAIVHQYEAQ